MTDTNNQANVSTTASRTSHNDDDDDLLQTTKQSLKAWQVQRQALESEASAIISELTAPTANNGPPMGVDTPLVDAEGYPRADVDVYRARTLRGRLATLRTDHQHLSQQIATGLERLALLQNPHRAAAEQAEQAARRAPKPKPKYDAATGKWIVYNSDGSIVGLSKQENKTRQQQQPPPTAGSSASPSTPTASHRHRRPFAKVNSVAADSPAAEAGLLEDDLIISFGKICIDDGAQGFQSLARLVPEAAGNQESIELQIQRRRRRRRHTPDDSDTDSLLTLCLTPRPWAGRGLIGCHIVPYSSNDS